MSSGQPTVLITGANRGLGLELARQYAADGWSVLATVRSLGKGGPVLSLPGTVTVLPLEISDSGSITALVERLDGARINLLINNAGVYPDDAGPASRTEIDFDAWADAFAVNTLGPMRLSTALLPNLRAAGGGARIVAISSLMGSLAENTGGGAYAYRSSKAALNAAMHSLALDLRRDGITVVIMSPGWVRTDMGGPSAPLSIPESVSGMRRVIDSVRPAGSGRFFNYDGRELPW